MKVVLLSHSDLAGGAARATNRIHTALRAAGVDSTLAVRRKLSDDEYTACVHPIGGCVGPRLEAHIQRLQRTGNEVPHSSNVLPTRWSAHLAADLVNVHWIGSGTMSVEDVGRIQRPVVMTLHDMWGFCGSEHYAPDCSRLLQIAPMPDGRSTPPVITVLNSTVDSTSIGGPGDGSGAAGRRWRWWHPVGGSRTVPVAVR